ncbi:hypothetical protein EYF80_060719 [Liparis tanakae]|uniref:Uncharacterized protein n=1 Tax=Liparis tanakae TaxID=230148 RepID=A0A4Z2EJZ3_9TELE|nr:hypothetical protein EYF80_060719 [Liparis tanakae]
MRACSGSCRSVLPFSVGHPGTEEEEEEWEELSRRRKAAPPPGGVPRVRLQPVVIGQAPPPDYRTIPEAWGLGAMYGRIFMLMALSEYQLPFQFIHTMPSSVPCLAMWLYRPLGLAEWQRLYHQPPPSSRAHCLEGSPGVLAGEQGAEHHAVVDGHGAVLPEQLRGALQEAVAGVAGVTVDRQLVVGRVGHDGELAVLGVDLRERNAVSDAKKPTPLEER